MRMKTIGVIGAGQMGAGIAQIAAARGLQVLLADVSEEAAHAGKARIGASLEKAVSREKLHAADKDAILCWIEAVRSEEHTSELQSLMRISYAVFCLKKK